MIHGPYDVKRMSFFSLFRPEKYSRYDFAFHTAYNMSQFIEKSEE